nr:3'(2'),5'-bisphosphate nucleotidase CysQ [Bdellovibrio sp. HAGR004]
MRHIELKNIAMRLLPLAVRTGGKILEIYSEDEISGQRKLDGSPVTEADLIAHRALKEGLQDVLPGCPLASEEDDRSWAEIQNKDLFWLIDPLDGTKEFLSRSGEFTLNIALIENGRPCLGVVYAPALSELYWGGPELGAFFGKDVMSMKSISVMAGDGGVCRVVASRSHLNAETKAYIDSLGPVELIQAGSSLKICRIAQGKADIYPRLSPTSEWDTAAAQAVLEGAGGVVVDLAGRPLSYGKESVLNPHFVAMRKGFLNV